ncbi:hypothetical protein ACFUOZ_20315, partial [Paenarthrobacter sp. NPDC057355]|uniref:hypothetical protein n=1 Tax=Paenarthrobacter sp. NPDC057355 TaxID=3346105 RepID=UPI003643B0E6
FAGGGFEADGHGDQCSFPVATVRPAGLLFQPVWLTGITLPGLDQEQILQTRNTSSGKPQENRSPLASVVLI